MNKMKTILLAALLVMLANSAYCIDIKEEKVEFGPFGSVHLYRMGDKSKNLVLFISGDGGWNLGVIDMARELASTGALVAGIDINDYLKALGSIKEPCSYPAAHFEALSQFLQKKYGFAAYKLPVLVGYSSGATLVYAILAQSPANTFQGGISLGFCPDLPLPKPLCKGSGSLTWKMAERQKNTYIFDAVRQLPAPWVALQGTTDQVCPPGSTKAYVEKVGNGRVVMLPKVGHGYSVPRNWLPQFKQVFKELTEPAEPQPQADKPPISGDLAGLPLELLPVSQKGKELAVIVSGDGGWAGIDKSLGEALNTAGIPVVGLNSLQYFWSRKDPEQTAKDMGLIIDHYSREWSRDEVILIGYSRGADVVPFMVNRMDSGLRKLVKEIVLIGPEPTVDFQFHLSDWLTGGKYDTSYPLMPEMEKLRNQNVLCIYGSEEATSLCPELDKNAYRIKEMKGGHHYGGNYDMLARLVLAHINAD